MVGIFFNFVLIMRIILFYSILFIYTFCTTQPIVAQDISFIQNYQDTTKSSFFRQNISSLILVTGGITLKSLNQIDISAQSYVRNQFHENFRTHFDDFSQFIPISIIYGFDLTGKQTTNKFLTHTELLFASELLISTSVYIIKHYSNVLRPDGSNFLSFPSGHTAQAFLSAAFFLKEYPQKNLWITIGAFSIATLTGFLRIANNKHYFSDVLCGAGIGIFSVQLSYKIGEILRKHHVKNKTSKFL